MCACVPRGAPRAYSQPVLVKFTANRPIVYFHVQAVHACTVPLQLAKSCVPGKVWQTLTDFCRRSWFAGRLASVCRFRRQTAKEGKLLAERRQKGGVQFVASLQAVCHVAQVWDVSAVSRQ